MLKTPITNIIFGTMTLGYRGYTKSCCISVNHVVCHGIPGEKTLKDGDMISIGEAQFRYTVTPAPTGTASSTGSTGSNPSRASLKHAP